MNYIDLTMFYIHDDKYLRLGLIYDYAETDACTVKVKISSRRFININVHEYTEISFIYYDLNKENYHISRWTATQDITVDVAKEIVNLGIEINPVPSNVWNRYKDCDRTGWAEINSNGYIWWNYEYKGKGPVIWNIIAHGFRDNLALADAHLQYLWIQVENLNEPGLVIDYIKTTMDKGTTKKSFLNRLNAFGKLKFKKQIIY